MVGILDGMAPCVIHIMHCLLCNEYLDIIFFKKNIYFFIFESELKVHTNKMRTHELLFYHFMTSQFECYVRKFFEI